MKLVLKRRVAMAHQLVNKEQTPDWNKAVYGPCTNVHGHQPLIEIEVHSQPNVDTGMIVNFTELKKLVDQFDHAFANDIVALPTAENIACYLKKQLKARNEFDYIRVRVYETDNAYVEDDWRLE